MDQDNGYFNVNSTANLTPMKKDADPEKERTGKWTWILALSGIATTIGCSVPVGYNIGVINAPQKIIQQWCNVTLIEKFDLHLDEDILDILRSTIVSIFLIGGMIGSLAGSVLADKIGRKGALLLMGAIGIVAAILFVIAKECRMVELILVGRFLAGLTSGVTTGVMPMYLCELAPSNLRAAMGTLCPLGLTLGVVLSQIMGLHQILGNESSWHLLLALYAVLVVICGFASPFMPESPKFLYQVKGLKQKAARELAKLRGLPMENVIGELEGQATSSNVETWSVMRVLSTPSLRLPLALTCALQFGQQTSGINAVFYYSVSIFQKAGLSLETAGYANIGAGLVNFLVAVIMVPLISQLPNRKLTIISCFFTTIMLFSLTICISYIDKSSYMPPLTVAAVLTYVLVYGIGLGPIPYFIGSELFDVSARPAAMALGSVANWSGNFGIGMMFPLMDKLMNAYSFLVFAFCTALLTVFLKLFLPETNTRYRDSADAIPHPHVQTIHHPTSSQKKGERMLFQSIQDL